MFKSPKQPFCRCCGKPIGKRTITLYVTPEPTQYDRAEWWNRYLYGAPATKAELQGLLNRVSNSLCVVSVKKSSGDCIGETDSDLIVGGTAWDGESYADEFFCTNRCAIDLARLLARQGHCTKAYNMAALSAEVQSVP